MDRRDLLRLAAGLSATSFASRASAQGKVLVGGPAGDKPFAGHTKRVVVVGAGISGLAAARSLIDDFGLDLPGQVVVLESRNRVGGRICTDTSLSAPVELGAGWIHGVNGNPITALANQAGATLATTDYDSEELYDIDGSPVPVGLQNSTYQQFLFAYFQAQGWIASLGSDQSLAQTFADIGAGAGLGPKAKRVFDYWISSSFEGGWTAYTSQLSSFHHDMGLAFSGQDRLFPGGYSQIVDFLAQGLDVRTDHVVEEIDYSGDSVLLHTNRGAFAADACIVTLPLGVLKKGHVAFAPALPAALVDAIGRMGFGAVHRLVLEFPFSFWDSSEFVSYLAPDPTESTSWLNVGHYSNAPILNTWTFQDQATSLESMGLQAAKDRVMQDLVTVYGAGIPDPVDVRGSEWNTSPFTGGSYSYPAVGSSPADYNAFLAPVGDKVFFAGEHTSAAYPSTVHGAYLSGQDAAARCQGVAASATQATGPWARRRRASSRVRAGR